jgi:4-alpha-glucanotransferase/(1->4)-alpha-D-glucan 1-alpha-D-glucosylmutase
MSDPALLTRLGALAGVEPAYRDAWGHHRDISAATRRKLLAAMGIAAETDMDVERSANLLEESARVAAVQPVLVIREDEQPAQIMLTFAAGSGKEGRLEWILELEGGARKRGALPLAELSVLARFEQQGGNYARRALTLPHPLPLGYHDLTVRLGVRGRGIEARTRIIVTPRRAYRPGSLEGEGRRWGIAVQLYGLRSARNWGIGDFTDLIALIRGAARLGAAAVGLNPLHALPVERPEHASPYSPTSRLFLNPLYLDIEAIEDFRDSDPAHRLVASARFQEDLRRARASPQVAYSDVAACKLPALELLYRAFRERRLNGQHAARIEDFQAFRRERGERLRRFALFQALAESEQRERSGIGWQDWPAELRDPRSDAAARFAAAHEDRIEYYEYLQWQAEIQLARAADVARRVGMSIGLYNDLAVGADGGGAEAWDWQELLVWDASVGAPPDAWNLKGQDWGLRPFHPLRLRAQAYAPFVEILRANMRRSGALRIDHVLGLMRLYWVPFGSAPTEGAYVAYPWRDLIGLVALESVRNTCLVIGEDLGTMPEGLREALADSGIFSYRLFYFEKSDGRLCRPEQYPREALVSVGTHDLPTLSGFWQGSDLALRDRLDLWPTPAQRNEAVRAREEDRTEIRALLDEQGLLAPGPIEPQLARAAYGFLARTPCRLLMVQPEDMIGQIEQVNLPGTHDEHPNWRQRLAVPLEALLSDARARDLAEVLNDARDDRPSIAAALRKGPDEASAPRIPRATYRLQLTRGFTFDDAARVASYLSALGVSHLYTSPWLKARAGSSHGYDITDHNVINPELGGEAAFDNLAGCLGELGLGQILDFVPNHMGIGKADNAWWLDVLEWGQASPYADYFDIDWHSANRHLDGKVLLPLLGDHYGQVLEAGQLVPRFDAASGTFSVWYHEHRFPISPTNYAGLIHQALGLSGAEDGSAELETFAEQFAALHPARDDLGRAELRRVVRALQADLALLAVAHHAVADRLACGAAALVGTPGERSSFQPLHELLEQQHYRLASWRVASDEINYRRFFNINELAGIRIENPALFDAVHALVHRLLRERKLHGMRIDHIDGLFDPADYVARLQSLASSAALEGPLYVVVEKILARHERLREGWQVAGTTGYDFLAQVNGLFVDARNEQALTRNYERFIGRDLDFDDVLHESKQIAIEALLASELGMLARDLNQIAEADWRTRDYTLQGLRTALGAVIACFPVYRTYVTASGIAGDDRRDIAWAVAQARKRWRGAGREMLDFVEAALTADLAQSREGAESSGEVARFAMKVQQYTGPVMAKGLEDMAFYRFNRLISLNEVGSDPRQFGLSPGAYHRLSQERARHWPNALLATSSHDTKRGEDVRARLNALSELPAEWGRHAARWARFNRRKKREVDGRPAPGRNDEYLLYQMLLGAWPPELDGDALPAERLAEFAARIKLFMRKAGREAQERTSWMNPSEEYEAAVDAFIERVLDPKSARVFLADFRTFAARIARLGVLTGLAQLALKLTSPGVPDIYQGTELWDLSLVDPDNRRIVDFARRERLLSEMAPLMTASAEILEHDLPSLRDNWHDGRIKLYLTARLLSLRRDLPALFAGADYHPLEMSGPAAEHGVAFLRGTGTETLVTVVGRLFASLMSEPGGYPSAQAWGETAVLLPAHEGHVFKDVLTGRTVEVHDGRLMAAALFHSLPASVLIETQ